MQVMEFRVFNISRMTQELKGRVALTPGSRLTWIGFSEEGSLSSYDSEVCFLAFWVTRLLFRWYSLHTTCMTTKKFRAGCVKGFYKSIWWLMDPSFQVCWCSYLQFPRSFVMDVSSRCFLLTEFIIIFSTSKEKKQEENYWVVGLNTTSLYCIACKYPEIFPQVYIIALILRCLLYPQNIGCLTTILRAISGDTKTNPYHTRPFSPACILRFRSSVSRK